MSWLFSRALVEACSPPNSSETQPCAQLNVMPTLHPFWRNDKTMEPSRFSRFGLTFAVLTASRGEELLTAWLEGFRAKTSAAPGIVPVLKERAQGCGESLSAWFARLSPGSSEWRTPQTSLLEDWELFSETWPRSGSMRSGTCYLRQTLAPTICVSASGSLLPTLTVNGNGNRPYPGKKSGYGLATAVALLPTLTTIGLNGGSNSRRATAKRGESPTHRGPLNPDWCEWFMGFPIGWTASSALETHKYQEWRQQHSPHLRLNLNKEQA
jgi:hypothetical protein